MNSINLIETKCYEYSIYILEIIAKLAVNGLTNIVKIVPSVYLDNECICVDIYAIFFA